MKIETTTRITYAQQDSHPLVQVPAGCRHPLVPSRGGDFFVEEFTLDHQGNVKDVSIQVSTASGQRTASLSGAAITGPSRARLRMWARDAHYAQEQATKAWC